MVYQVDARIADASVQWIPDPLPAFRGAGVLRVDLQPEDGEIRIAGKRRRNVLDDRSFLLRINIATVRLELRPVVNHHPTRNELRLRALPTRLLNKRGEPIGIKAVDVLSPGRFKVRDRIVERRGEINPSDLAGLDLLGGVGQALGSLIRPIVEESLVGGLLFGVPEADTDPVRLQASAVLEATASAGGELDLRYRGERVNFSDVMPRTMEAIDTDPFCCALPEPSPNCLDADFASAPDMCGPDDCPVAPFAQCVDWRPATVNETGMACFP